MNLRTRVIEYTTSEVLVAYEWFALDTVLEIVEALECSITIYDEKLAAALTRLGVAQFAYGGGMCAGPTREIFYQALLRTMK